MLPVSFHLRAIDPESRRVWLKFREDVMRPPSVTQESFRNHLGCNHPSNHLSTQASIGIGDVASY